MASSLEAQIMKICLTSGDFWADPHWLLGDLRNSGSAAPMVKRVLGYLMSYVVNTFTWLRDFRDTFLCVLRVFAQTCYI